MPSEVTPMPAAELGRPCPACGRPVEEDDADQFGWCDECRKALRSSARRRAHWVAAAITAPFALWVVLEGRFDVLPVWAWLLPLAVAYYLGHRIGREVVRGYARWKRSQAGTD